MIRLLSILLMVCFLALSTPSGAERIVADPVWVQHPGNQLRDAGQNICPLPDGSILVTGWWEEVYDAALVTQPKKFGMRDIFWAKYDPQGQLVWVKSAGSEHCDESGDISALPDGTFAVLCHYGYGGIDGTFGYGERNRTVLNEYDKYDIALAKCNPDGTLIWARKMGGYDFDFAKSVALAPNGGCYVVGYFSAGCRLGDNDGLDGNEVVFVDGQTTHSFLAFYDADGVLKWAKDNYYDSVEPLSDNTCLAMCFGAVVRYSQTGEELWRSNGEFSGEPEAFCVVPNSREAIFASYGMTLLRKYQFESDNSATLLWERNVSLPSSDLWSLAARPDGSFVGCSGYYPKAYAFDSAGNVLSAMVFSAPLYSGRYAANPVDNSFYVSGAFWEDITIGQGMPGETPLTHRGAGDIAIAKFAPKTLYEVKVAVEGPGIVLLDPPYGAYPAGAEVTARAYPRISVHDEFIEWRGDFDSYIEPEATITTGEEDVHATAVFDVIPGAPAMPVTSALGLLMLVSGPVAYLVARKKRQ